MAIKHYCRIIFTADPKPISPPALNLFSTCSENWFSPPAVPSCSWASCELGSGENSLCSSGIDLAHPPYTITHIIKFEINNVHRQKATRTQ